MQNNFTKYPKPVQFITDFSRNNLTFYGAYNMLVFGFRKSTISAVSALIHILSNENPSLISCEYDFFSGSGFP